MINANHCKIHSHADETKSGSEHERHTRTLNTKIHLVANAHGMPIRVQGLNTDYLLMDHDYDSNAIIEQTRRS